VETHLGRMDISTGRWGPLPKKERSFQKANHLCMYCGKSGHFASTCPESNRNNNKGKQHVNAAITASPTPATTLAPATPSVAPNASVLYATAANEGAFQRIPPPTLPLLWCLRLTVVSIRLITTQFSDLPRHSPPPGDSLLPREALGQPTIRPLVQV
jgi:hypothetical protein